MKLTGARLERFLEKPDSGIPLVLLYGPDRGLVRERAEALVRAVVDDPHDPFRIAEVSGRDLTGDAARLTDEVGAIAMTGGRRVVRLRDATDSHTGAIKELLDLAAIDSLVIVDSGDLAPRSSLRKLFETSDRCGAVPCYSDGATDIQGLARKVLGARDIRIDADAMAFVVGHLGSDREVSRRELEKLADYTGDGGQVTLADVMACIGDSAATSVDSVVLAAADGNFSVLELSLARVNDEGTSPIAILRAAARHWQRLHFVSGLMDSGLDVRSAMGKLRPPVFFFHADRFAGQARAWNLAALADAMEWITEAECDCKTGGMPAELLCHRVLMRLAGAARRGRR